jgi:hypothetical protein
VRTTWKPVLAGVFLAGLSGAAMAQTTPATRACMVGEQMIGGVCQPLTRSGNQPNTNIDDRNSNASGGTGPNATGSTGSGGNQNTGASGAQGGTGSGGSSGSTGNQNTGGSGGSGSGGGSGGSGGCGGGSASGG